MFPKSSVTLMVTALVLALAPGAFAQVTQPLAHNAPTPEGYMFSYAVKFVCGFQRNNVGVPIGPVPSNQFGEPVVKAGNYATDINIFNPGNDNAIWKRVLLLVDEGQPVGREPAYVQPIGGEDIGLPSTSATFDDCNKILNMIGRPPSTGLNIGFLQIKSNEPLDVTAVYTAEICSDMVLRGATGCSTPPSNQGMAAFGAGLSIDVESVYGRLVPADGGP